MDPSIKFRGALAVKQIANNFTKKTPPLYIINQKRD